MMLMSCKYSRADKSIANMNKLTGYYTATIMYHVSSPDFILGSHSNSAIPNKVDCEGVTQAQCT